MESTDSDYKIVSLEVINQVKDEKNSELKQQKKVQAQIPSCKRELIDKILAEEELKQDYYFKHSRTYDQDYHFLVKTKTVTEEVLTSIRSLNDYNRVLVNGTGYYSFQQEDYWIMAEVIKTDKQDDVGRDIYETKGYIYPIKEIQGTNLWFKFILSLEPSLAKRNDFEQALASLSSLSYLEEVFKETVQPATTEMLYLFLVYCLSAEEPIQFGYAVLAKDIDLNNFDFSYRFKEVDEDESWLTKFLHKFSFLRDLIRGEGR